MTEECQPFSEHETGEGRRNSFPGDETQQTNGTEALVRQLRTERESKLRDATLEINESSEQDDSDSSSDLLFCRMENISNKPPVQFDQDDDADDWKPQDNDQDQTSEYDAIDGESLEQFIDNSFVKSPQSQMEDVDMAAPEILTSKVQDTARQSQRKISTQPSRKEHEMSKEIGLRRLIGISKLTAELYLRGKLASTPLRQEIETAQKSRKRTTRLSEQELQSLFVHSDIIESAGTNSRLPSAPGFTSKNRKVALEEMVASIPIELKAEARSDKRMIEEAIKKFDHKPRSDGQGGWKVKGMKISLYHHQVLAVGWMRDRERSHTPPQGGLLCDVMGLGKTVTALTTILDGRCLDEGETRAPTLIVVPSQLSEYWVQQIRKHYDPSVFGAFYKYEAKSSSGFEYNRKGIICHDAVIATFEDIRRSYPTPKAPKELESREQNLITQWWSKHYDTEVGIFHRIKWQRIVLDEAHYIKNPDSHTSIAVRALHGRYKWVLSGTPLHNCVEEMFPYFNFLGVPNSFLFSMFKRSYCDHDASKSQVSKNRLINILRSILHRKTHESRFMGRPLVELPNITERHITVDLCGVETLLYRSITNIFIEEINSVSDASTQWKCILTMFLKLRMFISHVLTAQDIVQYSLKQNDALVVDLKSEAEDDTAQESARIFHAFLVMMDRDMVSEPPLQARNERLVSASALGGDHRKLSRDFDSLMKQLHKQGNWTERWRRLRCAHCKFLPTSGSILASCLHLYCEECFTFLSDTITETESEGQNLTCHSCTKVITAAAYCDIFDRFNGLKPGPSTSCPASTSKKRKVGGQERPESEPSIQAIKRIVKRSPKTFKNFKSQYGMFHSPGQDDTDSFEDEDSRSSTGTYTEDWIPIIGNLVPGAKLTEVRVLIRSFIESDPAVKIVVFTQFIDTTRLLEQICKEETWDYCKMTGRMPISARNESISKFRENPDVKIMIASLKTGGVGLDLSVANKCIMVDLWWNEAIEEQAYCRLFRIGQKREVEYVKIIARKTFDEKLLDLQKDKTKRIKEVISPEVLDSRDTDKQLLEWFGEIQQVKGGGFKVLPHPEKPGDDENDPIIMD